MAGSFKIDIKVQTPDGETIPYNPPPFEVQAYGAVKVALPCRTTKENPVKVDVQPSDTDQLKFLLITADKYDGPIQYSVDEPPSGNWITLAALQMIPDNGLLPRLFPEAPKTFCFSNGGEEEREIMILVGRTAVISGPSADESCEEVQDESTEGNPSQSLPAGGKGDPD